MAKFCREQNIAISTFTGWIEREVPKKNPQVRFVPLAVRNEVVEGNSGGLESLEVRIGEATIIVNRGFDVRLLQQVVAALGGKC